MSTVDAPYFTNAVTELVLEEGAVVEHGKFQDESLSAFSSTFTSTRSICAASTRTGAASSSSTETRSASAPRPSRARETSSSTLQSSGAGSAVRRVIVGGQEVAK